MLGDFCFRGNDKEATKIFDRLNGHKVLIEGNHDNKHTVKLPWKEVHDTLMLRVPNEPKYQIFLSHYAHRTWNKSFHGVPHLFGHSHSTMPPQGQSFDVGVDCWNYAPIDLDQVKVELERLKTVQGEYKDDPEYEEFLRLSKKFTLPQS